MSASTMADVILPAVVFVLMAIVGTDVRTSDLLRIRSNPRSVIVCTATQITLVPIVAILLIKIFEPEPTLALGLAILSICPSGALSNYYVYVNRGHVALSVTLTAVSTFVYIFAFPVLALGVLWLVDLGSPDISLPLAQILVQLTCFLLIPVLLGMSIRHRFPSRVEANRTLLDIVATILLLITISISVMVGWPALIGFMGEIATLAALFTVAALAIGRLTAQFVQQPERSACVIECAVRNIPIAILLINDIVTDVAAIGFAIGYFFVHAPVVVAYSALTRLGFLRSFAGQPRSK